MRKLIIPGLLSVLILAAAAASEQNLCATTLRLRLETTEGNYVVTGHGSAFGVDLSAFGIESSRYMLSAAHLVLAKDGRGVAPGELRVETGAGPKKTWTRCKVVGIDRKNDLCLLECSTDLACLSKLAGDEPGVGAALLIVGCPRGVPPEPSRGKLTSKEPDVDRKVWQAEAKFWHGNSGGPVFEIKDGRLVGVAVAGVQDHTGDMSGNIALFAPLGTVRKFLEKCAARITASRRMPVFALSPFADMTE